MDYTRELHFNASLPHEIIGEGVKADIFSLIKYFSHPFEILDQGI